GHRLKMLTALATGIFGGFGLLAAPIIYFAASGDNARSDVPPPGVAVIPLVLGAGATALAVALYVNARRVYRRQHSFAARLGRRLHEGPDDPDEDPNDLDEPDESPDEMDEPEPPEPVARPPG